MINFQFQYYQDAKILFMRAASNDLSFLLLLTFPDLWLKSNYRKNGTSYCIGVSGAEPTERLPEEEMAAAWDDPALDF